MVALGTLEPIIHKICKQSGISTSLRPILSPHCDTPMVMAVSIATILRVLDSVVSLEVKTIMSKAKSCRSPGQESLWWSVTWRELSVSFLLGVETCLLGVRCNPVWVFGKKVSAV